MSKLEAEDLKLIFNAIESGKCLAFLGAGACCCYHKSEQEEVPGLPTGSQLAKALADQCEYTNGRVHDLAEVAEYFVYTQNGDRRELERTIQRLINIGCPPRPIHTVLAQLNPIKVIITSNYDTLLETELAKYSRIITKNVYKRNYSQNALFRGPVVDFEENELVLHKMHGSIDEPESMVITQSDYIRYLATLKDPDRGMSDYFWKTLIPSFTLLFLGYSLEDWNFRVIWDGVLSQHSRMGVYKFSYALVNNLDPFQKDFWIARKIKIIDQDLIEFAVQLAEHFNLEIPQLGIKRKPEGGVA